MGTPTLITTNPRATGSGLCVAAITDLAVIDPTGMTLGTSVYVVAAGQYFGLTQSSATVDHLAIEAVSGNPGLRWQAGIGGSFGADTVIKLPNITPALVTALEMITALTNSGAGAEASALVFKLLAAGAQATALTLDGQGVALPDGTQAAPSLTFASEPGRNTGWFYAGPGVMGYAVDAQLMAYFGDVLFGFRYFNRINETRVGDVASGGTLTLGAANWMGVTGTTAVNFIATNGWNDGARVDLYIPSGVTFNHATASPPANTFALHMASAANTAIAAGHVVSFRKHDGLAAWVQLA